MTIILAERYRYSLPPYSLFRQGMRENSFSTTKESFRSRKNGNKDWQSFCTRLEIAI